MQSATRSLPMNTCRASHLQIYNQGIKIKTRRFARKCTLSQNQNSQTTDMLLYEFSYFLPSNVFLQVLLETSESYFFSNLPILKVFFLEVSMNTSDILRSSSSKRQPIFTVPSSTKSFNEADFRENMILCSRPLGRLAGPR